MSRYAHIILTLCLTLAASFTTLAEAPVVDDSENFALLEEQQAGKQPPAVHEATTDNYDDNQPALAREDTPAMAQENQADLVNKLQGLQQDIQELRGQLEVQTHELKLLQEQQLSFYKDLDTRLRDAQNQTSKKTSPTNLSAAETKPAILDETAKNPPAVTDKTGPVTQESAASTTQSIAVTTTANTNPADEQISYLAAYELVKNKRYDEAQIAMQTFVTKYPQGGYTANAQYWLGELFLLKKNYPDAISHFETVLQQFPSSSKYSASLLKMGYALAASGRVNEAKERLHQVMKKYPDTKTAELAHHKLEALGG